MEDVLHQLSLPYDPLCPLIYFDERPCFLIEERGLIIPMSPGKAKRYHYESDVRTLILKGRVATSSHS